MGGGGCNAGGTWGARACLCAVGHLGGGGAILW